MQEEEYLDKILKNYIDIISEDIPKQWFESWGYSASSMQAVLHQKNSVYKGGPYFYEGKKKFVHWTSISNLMPIINSREIRFYNLHNSTDPSELKFAAKEMGISDLQIENAKDHLYIFSFCEGSEVTNDYLWESYGGKYSGVAVEFEILNDPTDYNNFMLSNVYYELPDKMLNLVREISKLKSRFPGMTSEINLSPLISFHKKLDYMKEKEVRLSTYIPFREIEERLTKTNYEFRVNDKRPRITNYFGLKLWVDNDSSSVWNGYSNFDRRLFLEEDYFKYNPKIKISKITLGENSGIPLANYTKFKHVIESSVRDKLGYKVEIPLNPIRKTDL